AGMWQLMARTATAQGLQVGKVYDQRLDAIASTRVSLELVERYDREFGDWRLAVMAFNAGEYRVKRQLGNQSASSLDAKELRQLKLSQTTHQHLTRLLAMSCIVERPEMFGVDLPAPEEVDLLENLELSAPIDMRVAANLLGMPVDELRRFNAAWRADISRIGPVERLLVPAPHVVRFEEGLRSIPEDKRAAWHEQRVHAGDTLASLAEGVGVSELALAKANGLGADAEPKSHSLLLMPGQGSVVIASAHPETHVVKQGDTLSAIAHLYGVRVGQLLRWNNLDRSSILRLDMQLQLHAPQ
ncbi:LysM peptidoglycan-binding domain-containing protein, partial [Dokdonella sp.]|uniref:LysM peptidoglycan-binding domain-containing protein n=1 Tax=Dokdonella sp. TaxID=2291710 RepID=UPI003C45D885